MIELWVDPVFGDDNNDGSRKNPLFTISRALEISSEDTIYNLMAGYHRVEAISNLLVAKRSKYVGDPGRTVIVPESTPNSIPNSVDDVEFIRITFDSEVPGKFVTDARRLLSFGSYNARTIDMAFYNCLFLDTAKSYIEGVRHAGFIYGDGASSFQHKYKRLDFVNCVSAGLNLITTWNDRSGNDIMIYNSATDYKSIIYPNNEKGHGNNVKSIESLEGYSFEGYWRVSEDDLYGGVDNVSNTDSRIGLYGGVYDWDKTGVKILYRVDGAWYREVNGKLFIIDEEITKETFDLYGSSLITVDKEEGINYNNMDIIYISDNDNPLTAKVRVIPDKALLLANGDLSLKAVENIDFFQVDFTKIGDAEIKLIVSVDEGETWQTYESGMWEPINPTVEEVDLYGIDTSVFNLIRPERWNELRKYSDTIRFGYLLKHNEELDFAKVHALNAQFDMTGVWKASVHGKDFEYEYPDNSTIRVKILRNGDYKINY